MSTTTLDDVLDHAVSLVAGCQIPGRVNASFSHEGELHNILIQKCGRTPPADALTRQHLLALEEFLREAAVHAAFKCLAPKGTSWQFEDGGLVVRALHKRHHRLLQDRSGRPIGARILGPSTGISQRFAAVLGERARSMTPGTVLVLDPQDTSMHRRLHLMEETPGLLKLLDLLLTPTGTGPYPRSLFRFASTAVLSDIKMDLAWMAV